MTYIIKRAARGPPPADVVEHRLVLFASSGDPLAFPTPESLWTTRDVDREDWGVFVDQIGDVLNDTPAADPANPFSSRDGESDTARRQRVNAIVEEWNAGFFRHRGFRIIPVFGDDKRKDAAKQAGEKTETKGILGFKAGGSFVGVSLANGFGLRLPGGILLGVSTGKSSKEEEQK